ncbi:hypothetical protein Arad_9657 [Rhizobium rhizogenes K84]|uniref:Uncharacterized protein n=1 Tax=Rhizobium rhizogenes (strain K84 / ATCC BAA-868) TaxID=311403 RepID=B9JL65_RHIR8|nr:hypothetical protein Arad_9657 [Rhizobium rhizogenes K84]
MIALKFAAHCHSMQRMLWSVATAPNDSITRPSTPQLRWAGFAYQAVVFRVQRPLMVRKPNSSTSHDTGEHPATPALRAMERILSGCRAVRFIQMTSFAS